MRNLDDIIKELNSIKDKIYGEEASTSVDSVFRKLIKLNDIESELYETLILLYSNNKAEFDLIKHNHLVDSSKIVDSSISLVGVIQDLIAEIETLKEEIAYTKKKTNLFTLENILIFMSVFVGLFLTMIFTIHFFPEETVQALEFIKSITNTKLTK